MSLEFFICLVITVVLAYLLARYYNENEWF
jgi:hypothetical protein